VEVKVSFIGHSDWGAYFRALLGFSLYCLANTSYTIAVFTPPGSPLDPIHGRKGRRKEGGYEGLPTYEEEVDREIVVPPEWMQTSVTAKSTGKPRYCKKCQCVKPDRTHHCSTCGQCVLKMDHHCPWLATCVGLKNYKAFVLFLVYTSLFCWTCFAVSAWWVWEEFNDRVQTMQGLIVVNTILLSVLGGIIGLVLTGFTGWHLYLVATGQTTIESLERTRYLSPLKQTMESQFRDPERHNLADDATPVTRSIESGQHQPITDRLKEIHANALPGVLRPEEGDTPLRNPSPVPPNNALHANMSSSPAQHSLQRSYASLEAQRERERYGNYLDEMDSERLPNAFNNGWKRNFLHVMGEEVWKWPLPICNTTGDGWAWEVSPKFWEAKERMAREREARMREEAFWNREAAQQAWLPPPPRPRWVAGQGFVDQARNHPPVRADMDGEAKPTGSSVQMQPLDRRKVDLDGVDNYDTSSDEDTTRTLRQQQPLRQERSTGTTSENLNDIPEDLLRPTSGRGRRSPGRTKGD
jgi:palmitoyltransferase